jgi:hypothetical protein
VDLLLRYEFVVLWLLLVAGYFAARQGDSWFSRIECWGAEVAEKKGAVVGAIGLATVVLRVALLPVMPLPVPAVHDEFSFLLAADTFVHGRLANPPHPMWLFLETFHVLQQPTYASMYPPAQGAALALGQLVGKPWIAVLVSTGGMCSAVTWAIQGWLPARWALLGGVLLLLRIGLFSYWMDSYWGGSVAAIGGALVIGALPRIVRQQRVPDAVLMALGAGTLANSRPLEGFIFCLPVMVALLVWLGSKRSARPGVTLPRVVLPAAAVLTLTLAFVAYYNWRVTGDALLFPEMVDQKVYTNYPLFVWQAPKAPLHYNNPQFEKFYNMISAGGPRLMMFSLKDKSAKLWLFFAGSPFSLLLLAFPSMLADKRIRLLLIQFAWCFVGLVAVVWFFPHYAAPLTATIFILLVQAMRHLRHWEVKGRRVGVYFARLVVLMALARAGVLAAKAHRDPHQNWSVYRAHIVKQIAAMPGRHLVIVKYDKRHDPDNEWVYNAADIDGAKVVWARDIPGKDMSTLLEYFRDRNVWVAEADAPIPTLERFRSQSGALSGRGEESP